MKGISIRQPWAELILEGRKRFELRRWQTKYRGPLLIHAGKRIDKKAAKLLAIQTNNLVTGAIVGLAYLHDCRAFTKRDAELLRRHRAFIGTWKPNIFYAWELCEVERLRPYPWRGALGLFEIPYNVVRKMARER